ncbi:uncharacterized protein LOC123654758 [Melitaea cinxia]|uniref:uncharacterized protein LOC123654758 n=1 Tax=Melitaea cinxia TaxID=113334 RepID=UPI001E27214A|nr:uncharacterized protein LOC123654758 [Melitaea cinxia]
MDCYILILLACMMVTTLAWSTPFYPVQRAPLPPGLRVTRFAPVPHRHIIPPLRYQQPKLEQPERPKSDRPKREHYDYDDGNKATSGVTGPVHTFVKTDKNANYKWGVRHHVGNKYAS